MSKLSSLLVFITLSIGLSQDVVSAPSSDSNKDADGQVSAPLQLDMLNISEQRGVLRIAVFDNNNDWLAATRISKELKVNGENCSQGRCKWISEKLPLGEYAIAVYQDINNNGELDTNFIGLPKEPYGFSNDQAVLISPPSWNKSKFVHKVHLTKHTITLN